MKTQTKSFIRLGLVAMSFALATAGALAQKINTWKGGTPGRETYWNCPKNWSANTVPNTFSDVAIPDVSTTTRAMPVIRSGRLEVNALILHVGAQLTIEAGAVLVVHDRLEGIQTANVRGQGLLVEHGAIDGAKAATVTGKASTRLQR